MRRLKSVLNWYLIRLMERAVLEVLDTLVERTLIPGVFNGPGSQDHHSQLIEGALAGEEVINALRANTVVKLVPLETKATKRVFGVLKRKLAVGPEFFEPLLTDELDAWEQ